VTAVLPSSRMLKNPTQIGLAVETGRLAKAS
jgi:hypothetical protein